jgi:hypothetical protein
LTAQEEQHLQLLAIFHYIVGGLAAFFACFPLIHLTIGVVMVCGGFSGNQAPLAILGWLFIILGGGFFLAGQSLAVCIIIAGISRPAQTLSFRLYYRVLRVFVHAVRNSAGCLYDRFAVA